MSNEVKVSRAEVLRFGEFAPFMRLMGALAGAGESAREELEKLLRESQEADVLTAGQVSPNGLDESGRSEHTRFLEDLHRRLWPVVGECYELDRAFALATLQRWDEYRKTIDSQPTTAGHDSRACSNALSEDALLAILRDWDREGVEIGTLRLDVPPSLDLVARDIITASSLQGAMIRLKVDTTVPAGEWVLHNLT